MSKIKVDTIEGSTGTTITVPSGQTLTVTDGIAATNLSGTIADARLPTVPVAKGGTGLTSLGSAGHALKVNSGGNALEFGEIAGGGKLLQIVSASDGTVYTGTPGQSFIEPLTSLRAVITPSATSSKIYVILTLPMAGGDSGNVASGQLAFDTAGGSSNVTVPPNSSHQVDSEYAHFPLPLLETTYDQHSTSYSVLHSPNTTSALTYKFRAKSESSSGSLHINRTQRDSTSFDPRTVATITAMEIGV
tara:strand:- start:602 stop:1342 length:741 start_codon:yes stop_codon:yes gene_type:complete